MVLRPGQEDELKRYVETFAGERHLGRILKKLGDISDEMGYEKARLVAKSCRGLAYSNIGIALELADRSPELLRLVDYDGFSSLSDLAKNVSWKDLDAADSLVKNSVELTEKMVSHFGDFTPTLYDMAAQVAREDTYGGLRMFERTASLVSAAGERKSEVIGLLKKVTDRDRLLGAAIIESGPDIIDEAGYAGLVEMSGLVASIADKNVRILSGVRKRLPEFLEVGGYGGALKGIEYVRELLEDNELKAYGFVSGESKEYFSFMEEISKGLKLKKSKAVLSNYLAALLGYRVGIQSLREAAEKEEERRKKGLEPDYEKWPLGKLNKDGSALAFTDGRTIFLPEKLEDFEEDELNFLLYKITSTREEGHLEYGSFDFSLGKLDDLVKEIKTKYGDKDGKEEGA